MRTTEKSHWVKQEYFSVSDLEKYSGISRRTLWDMLKDAFNPIPHFRVGAAGRIVRVKRSDFDQWIETYRSENDMSVDEIVREFLK
jgi:excisionase family DNA binding protein